MWRGEGGEGGTTRPARSTSASWRSPISASFVIFFKPRLRNYRIRSDRVEFTDDRIGVGVGRLFFDQVDEIWSISVQVGFIWHFPRSYLRNEMGSNPDAAFLKIRRKFDEKTDENFWNLSLKHFWKKTQNFFFSQFNTTGVHSLILPN